MNKLLRAQHGSAINPVADEVVAAVTVRLSELADEGESFTTPDKGERRWAELFAQRAVCWPAKPARRAPKAEWQECHQVAAELAGSDSARYALIFGYALDNDAHWRTHSFVFDRKRHMLVEPTPLLRRAYIGVELDAQEAADFLTECDL